MDWYSASLEKTATIVKVANEYWIDDDGGVQFADGDVGDYNHDAHVIEYLLSKYDFLPDGGGLDPHDADFAYEYANQNWQGVKQYLTTHGRWPVQLQQLEQQGDPEATCRQAATLLSVADIFAIAGASPDEISIMTGARNSDPRGYAIQHMGWKRVEGENVETWALTPKDMQVIARGMEEIGEQNWEQDDGYFDDDVPADDDAEGEAEEPTCNIHVYSMGSWFRNVPLSVLETGNLALLEQYGSMRRNRVVDNLMPDPTKQFNPHRKLDGD